MDAPEAGGDESARIEARILADLLPGSVASAEVFGHLDEVFLFAQEEKYVEHAVDGRRRAFATGRGCARHALSSLGFAPAPLLADERGAPLWPGGVVGSITHCDGYCASAVARMRDVCSIGIDAEPNLAMPGGVLERIALPAERAWLSDYASTHPTVSWGRLLFSIKEAVYKARYQLTQGQVDFTAVLVTVDPVSGSFNARVQAREPSREQVLEFAGRWRVQDGLLVSATAALSGDASTPRRAGSSNRV